jgi:tetratricopeptide (TPR) repeat protein
MLKGTEQTPEDELEQAQDVLSWALRNEAPDAPFTIKAMIDVADQLARQDRAAEELVLREQAVAALREKPGPEHESTVNAVWKLATCLTTLGRPHDAEPLLADVVACKTLALGRDAPETLMAMAWAAAVAKKLGKLQQARALQEEVVAGYGGGRADDERAMQAALNLASTLTELRAFDEASRLLRHVLDVHSDVFGLESPKTLDVLEALTSVTFMKGDSTEAMIMARNLLEQRERVQGNTADETDHARALLMKIEHDDR